MILFKLALKRLSFVFYPYPESKKASILRLPGIKEGESMKVIRDRTKIILTTRPYPESKRASILRLPGIKEGESMKVIRD